MRRREFLTRLAVAGGGLFGDAGPIGAFLSQEQKKSPGTAPAAKAIRGLMERDGRFFQPVWIPFPLENRGTAESPSAVVRIDGIPQDQQTILPETQMLEVLTPAVEAERTANVTVEIAGRSVFRGTVPLKPVRKVLIYVLPHSHNDVGYTDIQTNIEKKQMRNIQLGIDLARKTADYVYDGLTSMIAPPSAEGDTTTVKSWVEESYVAKSIAPLTAVTLGSEGE